jgi:CRISPR-associated protein Csm2
LNEVAGQLGGYFAQGGEKDKLSSSQIRNVLDKLQRMKGFDMNRLQLLRPLLAYAAGRHGGKVRELQQISDSAIQLVQNQDHFVNFKNFFEAIVAYHRYHGGK